MHFKSPPPPTLSIITLSVPSLEFWDFVFSPTPIESSLGCIASLRSKIGPGMWAGYRVSHH